MVGSGRLRPDLTRLNPKTDGQKSCGAIKTPDPIRALITSCISFEPTQRPAFDDR